MSIPTWKKQSAGHYVLSDGAFEIIKGKPDWSKNDGRFPSTEWHLFDRVGNLIDSNRNYGSLAWDIEYKYRKGLLGEAQPTHRYRFTVDRHIERKTHPSWDAETTQERFDREMDMARAHPEHALAWEVRYITSGNLINSEELVQDDGSVIFHITWEYDTTPAMWEFTMKRIRSSNRSKGRHLGKVKPEKNPIKENV